MSLLTVIHLGKFKAPTGRRTKEVRTVTAIHTAQRRFESFIPMLVGHDRRRFELQTLRRAALSSTSGF